MRPENILIGVILFGLVIILGFNMFNEQINIYGSDADVGVFTSALQDISEDAKATSDALQSSNTTISTEDSESALAKSIYPKALSFTDNTKLFGKVLYAMSDKLHIPSYIIVASISIIGVLFAAFLIYWLRGFIPPKD